MLNYIWLGLIIGSIVIGVLTHKMPDVTKGGLDNAKTAVELSINLIGFMALWLGIMRLAERSGLTTLIAKAIRPLMVRLFPDVPPTHPAMGAMIMNMSANILGLGNAATPLGLRAMRHLESLNPRPGTATNAMCTFLAVNTSSIQLIPATVIAYLIAQKSLNPTAIVAPTILATIVSSIVAITAVKLLEKLPAYRLSLSDIPTTPIVETQEEKEAAIEAEQLPPKPLKKWGIALIILSLLFFIFAFASEIDPTLVKSALTEDQMKKGSFILVTDGISVLAIPFVLLFFTLYAALRGLKVYEEFVEGAKEGFQVAIRIIPFLVAILVAVGMFRGSGGMALLTEKLTPLLRPLGFPAELLPLVLMRPLSGGASLGLFQELVLQQGPDSLITRMGAVIMGSSETTFYVIAVYFGSVAIKRTRHAVPAGLIGDLSGVIAAVVICRLMFP